MEGDQDMKSVEEIYREIRFGVDYYPEHWPQERWSVDAKLMQELGIQLVRMAEFAWQKLEPAKGQFQFEWLDQAIELLGQHGIYTILGTPTAAPPAWIIEKNPEILPVDSMGQRKSFGGRHHDCQSNEVYRGHVRRLVTAMAEHYKDNPYVIGWQIDNELGNSHGDLCMCESCHAAFAKWLEKRYGTIEALNEAWGTVFWSQTYDSFEQVPTPRKTPTTHNPSLLLNWKRFCSDLVVDFCSMQADILRSIAPHQKLTHNLMGFYDKTDYYRLAQKLDFAANDQYPLGYYLVSAGQSAAEIAACMDMTRSTKHQNFWMMELQSGPTGGSTIGANPKPGQNLLWTAQCVAHGADTIVYFRWRTCLFGTEQFWHGILPHQGVPKRRYYEIQDTIRRLTPVMRDCCGVPVKTEAAILFSYEEDWAITLQPQHPDLTYTGEILRYYQEFYKRGIPVEFVSEEADFSDYKVLVAPLLYLSDAAAEKKLADFVRQGGTLVLTMRTGVMNRDNVCMSELPLPGALGEIAGVEVDEYDSLLGRTVRLAYGEDRKGTADKWCDILTPTTAKTLITYDEDYYKGRAAATVNDCGKGKVYYIGTVPDAGTAGWLANQFTQGLTSMQTEQDSVEMTVRRGKEKEYLFVMNHSAQGQEARIPQGWTEGNPEGLTLEPFGVQILEREYC